MSRLVPSPNYMHRHSSLGLVPVYVTSRRLIVTSYNLAIIRFWYPATNNRDRSSVFSGSKHHVFTWKIPFWKPLYFPPSTSINWLSYLFVCFCANRECLSYFDAFGFLPVFWWHPTVCTTTTIKLDWCAWCWQFPAAIPLGHWSRLFITVLKLHHDYSVSIFPTCDSTKMTIHMP